MSKGQQTVISALMDAKSGVEISDIKKANKREVFVDACNELGIEVTSDDQKVDLIDKIIRFKVNEANKDDLGGTQQGGVQSTPDETGQPAPADTAKQNNPIVRVNDRVEAVDLGYKCGVIAIVDGVPCHVDGARIVSNLGGPMIGRA